MGKNTVVGNIVGGIIDPVGTVQSALGLGDSLGAGNSVVGDIINPLGTGAKAIGKATEAPPLPVVKAPAPITSGSTANAANAAVSSVSQSQGRASNILSGPTGVLTSSANLYSASKQLLGS